MVVARQIGSSKSGAATGAGRLLPAAYRKPRKGEFRQPSAASTARAGGLKVLSALTGIPELMAIASQRFEHLAQPQEHTS